MDFAAQNEHLQNFSFDLPVHVDKLSRVSLAVVVCSVFCMEAHADESQGKGPACLISRRLF